MSNEVTVISSYAKDVLMRQDGSVISESRGGPALFIEKALQDARVPFDVYKGEELTVEIEIRDNGEYGRIANPSIFRKISEVYGKGFVVVSTLLDEWVIDEITTDKVFVDIQGYVRDGAAFGHKQQWPYSDGITKQIFCLKGTKEEISYLPNNVIADQKKHRMLIVTHGISGAIIYYRGEEYHISTQPITDLPDTIGAGDTFFAYYVASFSVNNDPVKAGQYAANKTYQFLARKR